MDGVEALEGKGRLSGRQEIGTFPATTRPSGSSEWIDLNSRNRLHLRAPNGVIRRKPSQCDCQLRARLRFSRS